jgi:hypothetical protein
MDDWLSDSDFSLSTSGSWDDPDLFYTPSFDAGAPEFDSSTDWSTIFSNPDWMNDTFGDSSFDWTQGINWEDMFTNPDYFGAEYDPLTDEYANTNDIASYIETMFGDDGKSYQFTPEELDLSIGSRTPLSLSGKNYLGDALNANPIYGEESNGSLKALNALLGKVLGTVKEGSASPLGKILMGVLAQSSKKKDVKNQTNRKDSAINSAESRGSQRSLPTNRRGAYTVEQRNPWEYVAKSSTFKE